MSRPLSPWSSIYRHPCHRPHVLSGLRRAKYQIFNKAQNIITVFGQLKIVCASRKYFMSKLYCYLEPGIPGIAAWLDIHVYVATCEIPGTRDPARAHTVHVSRWGAAGQRAPCGAAEIKPSLGAGPASVRSHWLEPSPPPSPTCPPRWRWWCCPGTPAQRRSRSPAPRPSQKSPLQWRIPRLEVDQFTSLFIQWCDVMQLNLPWVVVGFAKPHAPVFPWGQLSLESQRSGTSTTLYYTWNIVASPFLFPCFEIGQ